LQDHLVSTGLAADPFLDSLRRGSKSSEAADGETAVIEAETADVRFFRIQIRQPLDERWAQSPGCLVGEENWISYTNQWGVLASYEADARHRVLEWQQRCFPLPAEIVEVETGEETYQDLPGVVWQGQREGQSAS